MKKIISLFTLAFFSLSVMSQMYIWHGGEVIFTDEIAGVDSITFDHSKQLPESFPKTHLIEHFTGMSCGYCPYGILSIKEAIKGNESKFVWVSHHAGYANDKFTINASTRMASKFKVTGAPSEMLDRGKYKYSGASSSNGDQVFHPAYTSEIIPMLNETSVASISVSPSYNADTRELAISVKGQFVDETTQAKVTVLVKENGLHGAQSDYIYTYEGWSDFVHNNVPRVCVTNYLGDAVTVENNEYSLELTTKINDAWVAENCQVVAFVTDQSNNFLNATQAAIVNGTNGGSDIQGGGVTAVPVDDDYPETIEVPFEETQFSSAIYYRAGNLADGTVVTCIQMVNTKTTISLDNDKYYPFAYIYLLTDKLEVTPGTYKLATKDEWKVGNAVAGYRDDENVDIDGSRFFLAQMAYYNQGYLVGPQWLLQEGTVTVTDDGLTIEATTRNGGTIKASYNGNFTKSGNNAPRRLTEK